MNKYQEFIKDYIQYSFFLDDKLEQPYGDDNWQNIKEEISINQAEDYHITKYYLVFNSHAIESVRYNGDEYIANYNHPGNEPLIIICLDFNNKANEIVFNSHLVDSFSIPLKFIEIDHKLFDDKVAKENQDKLEQNACIQISTGNNLVNIYFQPCDGSYYKTFIDLYLANGNYSDAPSVMGKHDVFIPSLLSATPSQLIGKFEPENGMFFKSITGLAHHAYAVKIKQIDKEGKILFETDYKYFDIR